MRLKVIILLCFAFVLQSCATKAIRKVDGNSFISEDPSLHIKFSSEILDVEEKGQIRIFKFKKFDVRPVVIEIRRATLSPRRVDYYYSLETIASNANMEFMGQKYFNGHKWVRVAKVNEEGTLLCGYLSRKGHWLIYVFNFERLDERDLERYKEFRKTSSSEYIVSLIGGMFEELDRSTNITQ